MVAVLTQCPVCGCLGESLTYELGSCSRCGTGMLWRLIEPDGCYAVQLKAGMVIWHPVPDDTPDGSALTLGVRGPDEEGMMTLATPLGPVRVVIDWQCKKYTAADGDLAALLLLLAGEEDV